MVTPRFEPCLPEESQPWRSPVPPQPWRYTPCSQQWTTPHAGTLNAVPENYRASTLQIGHVCPWGHKAQPPGLAQELLV